MRVQSKKETRRRYYLHSKAKKCGNSVLSRLKMVSVSCTAGDGELRYARMLQGEYGYVLQTCMD